LVKRARLRLLTPGILFLVRLSPIGKLDSKKGLLRLHAMSLRSQGIEDGTSQGIPMGPDATTRDFSMFSKGNKCSWQLQAEVGKSECRPLRVGVRPWRIGVTPREFRRYAVEILGLPRGLFLLFKGANVVGRRWIDLAKILPNPRVTTRCSIAGIGQSKMLGLKLQNYDWF